MMTLKQIMRKTGISQRALAETCGVSQTAVWFWSMGVFIPKASHIPVLTKTFGRNVCIASFCRGKLRFKKET